MQPAYGQDPGIQPQKKNVLELKHRAKFATLCLDNCNGDLPRKYFYIWENSIEMNDPTSCSIWCPGIPFITNDNPIGCFECCVVPPNCCCPGADNISKTYFDRGMFDHQSCCWKIGFFSGVPEFFANEIKHQCLCMECPNVYNKCMSCYWPELCGERVRYIPATTCCCCISTKASWLDNCCGICGPLNGQPSPFCLKGVTTHLDAGEAQRLTDSFNAAIQEWQAYTGKK
jgi:hypothetical protein